MLKQTRRNRFLHIDGWQYQGLRSRLARHGPIGGIALRPSSFEVEMSLVIFSRKMMCKSLWSVVGWSGCGARTGWVRTQKIATYVSARIKCPIVKRYVDFK